MSAERSEADTHAEPAAAQAGERRAEGAHEEEPAKRTREPAPARPSPRMSGLLGVDLESTPLIVLAVLAGLALAALAATRFGRLRAFLLAIAAIALVVGGLDVREVVHQLDESRDGIALIAMLVAVLHLAAAAVSGSSPGRPATQTP